MAAVVGTAVAVKTYRDTKEHNEAEMKRAQKTAKEDAEEAKLEAKADALEAEEKAIKAETFSRSEGKGVGQLGNVSLEVDDDDEDEETGLSI